MLVFVFTMFVCLRKFAYLCRRLPLCIKCMDVAEGQKNKNNSVYIIMYSVSVDGQGKTAGQKSKNFSENFIADYLVIPNNLLTHTHTHTHTHTIFAPIVV